MPDFLRQDYLGNSVAEYGYAAVVFLGVLFGFLLARRVVINRLRALAKMTATDLDDIAVEMLELIRAPECYMVALYAATRSLALHPRFDRGLHAAVVLLVAYRITTMLSAAAGYAVKKTVLADGDDAAHRETAQTITMAATGIIWLGAVLFTLSNLGFNVTSMIAGLGISGIAVALAAQAVLGDLFSAVAIYLDKPFVVGDFIKVGDAMGAVEHIGVKTTRVRSLSGEMLVFPNSSLTSSRIQNFQQLRERRVVFRFGLLYDTPEAEIRAMPAVVRGLIERDPLLRFDRAHLAELGESALTYEVVYFVRSDDYGKMMDAQERLLADLIGEVRRRRLDFAFPTRTVHLADPAKA
ncbi:MAG: mechanosensitive ion channel [Elusimicrobiota bacterium]|nr:mechanosensitive ion channel [Elusimicrobiota bacterium]